VLCDEAIRTEGKQHHTQCDEPKAVSLKRKAKAHAPEQSRNAPGETASQTGKCGNDRCGRCCAAYAADVFNPLLRWKTLSHTSHKVCPAADAEVQRVARRSFYVEAVHSNGW
jgi:hypothetical protein